jgi:glycerol-3-phosphate dehydrogenase
MANLLVYKGHDVTLYGRNKAAINLMKERRMNDHYLPYVILSDRIKYTSDLREAVSGKSIVVFAVPTQQFRSVSEACSEWLEDGVIAVNLAKGIEQKTLKRLSEIASERSLRYALQLLTPARILAESDQMDHITVDHVDEAEELFIDIKRSTALIAKADGKGYLR